MLLLIQLLFFLPFTFSLFPNRGHGAAASAPLTVQIKNTETAKHKRTSETDILAISVNITAERVRMWSVLERCLKNKSHSIIVHTKTIAFLKRSTR